MTPFLLLTLLAGADVESGPKPDAAVPELKVTFATGTHEGKEIDIADERKDEKTVYLFINSGKFSRPIGRFVKDLDGKLDGTKVKAYAIWVGRDADKQKEYLPKVHQSLKFDHTDIAWTVISTPKGWGLNEDAHLTVVVAKDKKVVKVFPFVSVGDKDAENVVEALK